MCGKGVHEVRLLNDGSPCCYMNYFCDNVSCPTGDERCPHRGEGPCTCPVNRVTWEEIVDLLWAKHNALSTEGANEHFLTGITAAISFIEDEADRRDWTPSL